MSLRGEGTPPTSRHLPARIFLASWLLLKNWKKGIHEGDCGFACSHERQRVELGSGGSRDAPAAGTTLSRRPSPASLDSVIRPTALASLLLFTLGSAAGAPVEFQVLDAKGRPVPDAVVSLVPLDTAVPVSPPAAPLEIVQKGQEFLPYVTPLVVGTAVSFPNRDTVQHHVYSLSKPKKFELPLYAGQAKAPVVFDQPGVVALGCNIHDWMSAYVVVLATPWFALTGADGRAQVAAVPDGRYRAEVWHPRLARTETREISLAGGAPTPLAFTLTLKAERRMHRNPRPGLGGYP